MVTRVFGPMNGQCLHNLSLYLPTMACFGKKMGSMQVFSKIHHELLEKPSQVDLLSVGFDCCSTVQCAWYIKITPCSLDYGRHSRVKDISNFNFSNTDLRTPRIVKMAFWSHECPLIAQRCASRGGGGGLGSGLQLLPPQLTVGRKPLGGGGDWKGGGV